MGWQSCTVNPNPKRPQAEVVSRSILHAAGLPHSRMAVASSAPTALPMRTPPTASSSEEEFKQWFSQVRSEDFNAHKKQIQTLAWNCTFFLFTDNARVLMEG